MSHQIRCFSPNAARRAALLAALMFGAGLSAPAAAQNVAEDIARCGDFSEPPRVVADACRRVSESPDLPSDDRAAAAYAAGSAYGKVGAYADAEVVFTTAVELKPDFAEAFSGRAEAREELNNAAGAEADYNAAIALKPRDAQIVFGRGIFYFRQDREDDARADFYAAIDLDPTGGWPYVYLGAMDDLKGDDAVALEAYEEAFRLDPKIVAHFQASMTSQNFPTGVPGEYGDIMRAGLIDCMKVDCLIGDKE